MKWLRGILYVLLALAAAVLLAWRPWSHPGLAETTTVLPAPAGVAPPAGRDDVLAIVFSGDGGWRDLDQQLGAHLNASGFPVLGVSMLEYYWHGGSAEKTARELDALIDGELARTHKRRLWLVGFSFGADVLPTVIGRLAPEHRARIAQLVLLSPTRDLNFEIELEGYMQQRLGWLQSTLKSIKQRVHPVPHYPALPPLLALDAHPPVACYYGADEADDTVCTEPRLPAWVRVHAMAGDHHLGGDYGALAARMIAELPAAAAAN
ncbi:virulence protein [Frateuria sp. Soil773]|uniref:AcvB/VirJ family lysyl-phosphatidylglycerol hydrolase n=1 Tax=Frateuria sp. Soil773 TaxID=1736407 RepID=UPI0006F27A69|nr:AcvB/VirJ family lysyl-phosphatidylglycerol hydrolase [Frateuria sp. Soil773]KRE88660.1 virulence protein [Frateuria sp. Soil773]